jgi:PKD repeat protein
MKKIFFLIFIICVSIIYSQTNIPAGNVSGTWDLAGSPYLIEGEIEIPNGQTLTIDPGVLVEFQGHYKLNVQGRLLAVGTEEDSIKFTVADTTGFYNLSTTDGGWRGLIFDQTPATNDSSKIICANIEYVKSLEYGAGSYVNNFDKLIISNSTFRNNYADQGGAFNLHDSSCIIRNNLFTMNNARYGGALHLYHSSAVIVNNIITNNICTIYAGGMIISGEDEDALIINNSICHNASGNEGAVHIYGGVTLINNIIWHNQGCQISGAYNCNTLLYNNIENGLPNYPNYYETNLDFDPYFVDENDYHLNPISSCINRGIPDTTGLNLPELDFDGNPRIFDGENPRIDIGAYEYQGEPILFYPEFTFDGNFGAVPYSVQFTDLSEGEIISWEWDFDNDGIIDSYEQNPEFTYLEGGIFSVSLTISNGEYELTRTKYDIIETGDAYSFYQEKFRINKINVDDELCSIQLFDFNADGQKEIYTCYKNTNERNFRILGIDVNGETILNDIIQINNEDEILEKVSLLEYNNTGFVVAVLKTSNYNIIIRVHLLETLQMITEDISSFNGYSGCYTRRLKTYSDDESFIFVGLRISWYDWVCGGSFDKTIRCVFNGSDLIDVNYANGIGTLIHPQSNLGAGYSYWWDDMGGSGSSISFRTLDDLFTFASSSNTSSYGLVSKNDDFFEYYGSIIYISGYFKCYSPDYSTLLWEILIPLTTGFCSSNIVFEDNDHYILFYDYSNETVNIINRMNGQIVYSQLTSLHPFSIQKTASDELILFENIEDEYIVYTNDPIYYTGIEDNEIPQISEKCNLKNYPNPFNPTTTISFNISRKDPADAEIEIYNIKGQRVKTLIKGKMNPGRYSVIWNSKDQNNKPVGSGIYFYQLKVDGQTKASKKMLLLK